MLGNLLREWLHPSQQRYCNNPTDMAYKSRPVRKNLQGNKWSRLSKSFLYHCRRVARTRRERFGLDKNSLSSGLDPSKRFPLEEWCNCSYQEY